MRSPDIALAREMGLLGLVATGLCSMVGAGINVIPIMVQRNVLRHRSRFRGDSGRPASIWRRSTGPCRRSEPKGPG